MFKETRTRSVVKTFSWRVLATLTTAALVLIFTGRLSLAVTVGSLEFIVKIVIYFFHERLWDKIPLGRKIVSPFVVWLTGLPSSGKTAIAAALVKRLQSRSYTVEELNGEKVRKLTPEIGFSRPERDAHIKKVGILASILEKNKVIVVASFVSPYRQARDFVRGICKNFIEVYVDAPIELCEQRDKTGLYQKARQGLIQNFTGINDPYEPPENPEIILEVQNHNNDECVDVIIDYLQKRKLLA